MRLNESFGKLYFNIKREIKYSINRVQFLINSRLKSIKNQKLLGSKFYRLKVFPTDKKTFCREKTMHSGWKT